MVGKAHRRLAPLALGLAGVLCGGAAPADRCRGMAALHLADTTLSATEQPASEGRPAACQVDGTIRPTRGSRIGFQLQLPAQGWNGRLLMLGNGGYSSALPAAAMQARLRAGYAVVATDTGHDGDDPSFARGRPQAIVDWGERAVHLTAIAAKAIVARHYGQPARHAYFLGCSTGGHQGFMEAQRHPADFDGIVAGAPGHNRTHLNAGFLWQYLQNHRPGDDANPILPAAKLPMIARAAVNACRAQNGAAAGGLATDPYLNDPLACDFDPATLQCPGPDQADCLTAAQVTALRRMYQGATNPRTGERIYFGWPPGSEAGWGAYLADPANPQAPARANFWRDWVFHDPAWSWWRFDFDRDMGRADDAMAARINAMDPQLSAFRRRGGKLIHYHGGADPVAPLRDSVSYRMRVVDTLGEGATDGFYRFFVVPGMAHCGGGPGPAPVDLQPAIEAWVETGRAPDRLLASRPADQDGGAAFSRPLCPYPQVARYDGHGPRDDATSFACVTRTQPPAVVHPAPRYRR